MSDVVENPSPDLPGLIAPGSQPLANARREAYANERALCSSRLLAYRNAGFKSCLDHDAAGNGAKLERNQEMRDRIAWLCRQPEDVLRRKRERLEEHLWNIKNADLADYYIMVERPVLDKQGKFILDEDGNPMTRLAQDIKPFSDMTVEQRAAIAGLKYTDSGRPNLELYSSVQANIELRKMLGIGAQSQTVQDEFGEMSLKELAAFIAREQASIGLTELAKLANAGHITGQD